MLYFIKSLNLVKIGYTDDLVQRMSQYKTCNPQFELLALADGERIDETYLHSLLQDYKEPRYKEWFYDTPEVRQVWKDYWEDNKLDDGYIEYSKPWKRRISQSLIDTYGVPTLYNQPIRNIITGDCYKHVQALLESLGETNNFVFKLFVEPNTIYRFVNPEQVCGFYKNGEKYTLDKLYSIEEKVVKEYTQKIEKLHNDKSVKPWILQELTKSSWTYSELEETFSPLFEEHGLKWNKNTSIKYYFPPFTKKQRVVNKVRETCYIFQF